MPIAMGLLGVPLIFVHLQGQENHETPDNTDCVLGCVTRSKPLSSASIANTGITARFLGLVKLHYEYDRDQLMAIMIAKMALVAGMPARNYRLKCLTTS